MVVALKIEEVQLPVTAPGEEIEKPITDLVKALIGTGYKTVASCGGHLAVGKIGVVNVYQPYVNIASDVDEVRKLHEKIKVFNEKNEVKWKIRPRFELHGIMNFSLFKGFALSGFLGLTDKMEFLLVRKSTIFKPFEISTKGL